ncbi:MAG TPA: amidohydrolase [Tenuifilaceae bacterium]|nr:amidohydrolase [Tenuifilaceae bacterium]
MDELIRLRHELHRNPELSGKERATGKRIRFYLNRYRPDELFTGIAGEGMAAVFNAPEPGPTTLFRCDLDALPIHEAIRRPYSSTVPGVAHLCGHDGHMAMVSGLAESIKNNPLKKGRVILFYQPEEENGQGAEKSLNRLKELNLLPDYAFAIHNMPKYPLGSVVLPKNVFASASKGVIIKLIGKASHAAFPEMGINPALAISEIIQGLYGIANQKNFSDFVLLTIIHVRVGDIAFGTSPGFGEIMVTLRSVANDDMDTLYQKSVELARKIGTSHKLAVEISVADDFPATVCNPDVIETVRKIAIEQNRTIAELDKPNRWSEDFAHFTLTKPSVIFGLGIGEDKPELHSPEYDFPDEAIEHGVQILDAIINKYNR